MATTRRKPPARRSRKKPPPKRKVGRPPHDATETNKRFVETLKVMGVLQPEMARVLGITPKTLRKFYADEIEHAKLRTDALMVSTLILNATGGPKQKWDQANITALIFYMKTRMGWKEPAQALHHSGAVGSYDLTGLTDEQFNDLEKIILALPAPAGHDEGGEGEA